MPKNKENKIWFDGGEPENQPAETEPTEKPSTEKEATKSPKTYDVPGLGECTPEQIAGWHEDSKNKIDWRKANEDRGRELNELKRSLQDKNDYLNQQISEIKARPVQPAPPREDWRNVDDPDKKQSLFFMDIDSRISSLESGSKKFQDDFTAKEKESSEQKADQDWTILADDTLDKLGAPDDPKSREAIQGVMAQQLRRIGKANWSTTEFKKAGEYAINSYKEIKQNGAKELIEGKKKDKKLKTDSPGKGPAPTKVKITPEMSQAERIAIINKDPNVK